MSFQQIAIKELPAWVKVLKTDGITDKHEMLAELNLIDDLLSLQKAQALLNRKRNLKTQLEARIAFHIGHKAPNLNINK
ncbi:MAG: hypothetical protein AB7C90_04330 [Bacteroidales bacterium]